MSLPHERFLERAAASLGDGVQFQYVVTMARQLESNDGIREYLHDALDKSRADVERLGGEVAEAIRKAEEAAAARKQMIEEMELVRDSSVKAALFPAVRE